MKIIRDELAPGAGIYPFEDSIKFLRAVGKGEQESTLRLYRPKPNMAFGRRDEFLPGFTDAVAAASRFGYESAVRPVGGHAAGYHSGCLVIDHFQADPDAVTGNMHRFETFGTMYKSVLEGLEVRAGVGEIPGEYCPGEHSVHAYLPNGSPTKIVGTAQRVVQGAWWFSAGIVVEEEENLREVTTAVYRALGLELDPVTVGALSQCNPLVQVEDAEDAVLEAYEKMGYI